VQRQKMTSLVLPRKRLDEDLDHSTAAQADSEIDVVFLGRVVGHEARLIALDGPTSPKEHVALETASADRSGRPPFFGNQHPGVQAQRTSGSAFMCSMISSPVRRPPFRDGSFICSQICCLVRPSHSMDKGARCQVVTPGTKPSAVFAAWWHVWHVWVGAPWPS